MATRTIDDPKDRLTTILIAPLTTCSARLPVYALIIGACIPAKRILPGHRAAGSGAVRAIPRRHRQRIARRADPAPHRHQGAEPRLHDGDAQISDAEPARCRAWPVEPLPDLPQARRHDHPAVERDSVGALVLSGGAGRAEADRIFDRRADRFGNRIGGQADRLQPPYRAGAAAGDGGARGGDFGRSPPPMRSMPATIPMRRARRSAPRSPRTGRYRPRLPSSPGSCSHRNAFPPSPSPVARPTAGNGRPSWLPICRALAYLAAGATFWLATALGL